MTLGRHFHPFSLLAGWIQALPVFGCRSWHLPFPRAADEKHLPVLRQLLGPIPGRPFPPGSASRKTFGLSPSSLFRASIQICLESSQDFIFIFFPIFFFFPLDSGVFHPDNTPESPAPTRSQIPKAKVRESHPALGARLNPKPSLGPA